MLFPDDGRGHELIDGEHYVTASPNLKHQRVARRLSLLLGNWLDEHPSGEIFFAPVDVVLSPHDVVVPDLLYVSNERAAALTKANVQGAPDLVIEIGSPSTRGRDETIKRYPSAQNGPGEVGSPHWTISATGSFEKPRRLA